MHSFYIYFYIYLQFCVLNSVSYIRMFGKTSIIRFANIYTSVTKINIGLMFLNVNYT